MKMISLKLIRRIINYTVRHQSAAAVVFISVSAAILLAVTATSLVAPSSLRLHPGLFPLALAGLVCTCAGFALRQAPADVAAPAGGMRAILATTAAMLVLALATRAGGVFLATLASASIASAGASGVSWRRAALVGLGLAITVSACLGLASRQPLPILPPGLFP